MQNKPIRKSILAGTWYPGDPVVLRDEIEGYFRIAEEKRKDRDVVGLLAPHAGYAYSGQIAAYAYSTVTGRSFDGVIVIAPSHHTFFQGVSGYVQGSYETPLGSVPIDSDLAGRIMEQSSRISELPGVHAAEHAIEIQLPFLQVALGAFLLTPLIMGDQTEETCLDLAEAIVRAIGDKNILIVASSDLSHYHRYDRAVHMDQTVLRRIASMDTKGLLHDLEKGTGEACGGGPAVSTMVAVQQLGAKQAEILKYANSGDITGDKSGVVGYAAAVFSK